MTSRFTTTPDQIADQRAREWSRETITLVEDELRAELKALFTTMAEGLVLEAVDAAMHNLKVRAAAYHSAQNFMDELHIITTIKVE